MTKESGQVAYEARFAESGARAYDPWDRLSVQGRKVWQNVEEAVRVHLQRPVPGWREMGEDDPHAQRYDCTREQLSGGHFTDDQVAFALGMTGRRDLDFEGVLCMGKDRIRWLSRQLHAAHASLAAAAAEGSRMNGVLAMRDSRIASLEADRVRPPGALLPPGVLQIYRDAYQAAYDPGRHLPAHIAGLLAVLAIQVDPDFAEVAPAKANPTAADTTGKPVGDLGREAWRLKEAFDFLDGLHENAAPGQRNPLNSIIIGRCAKVAAETFRAALAVSPKGEFIPPMTREEAIQRMVYDGDADPEGTARMNYPELFAAGPEGAGSVEGDGELREVVLLASYCGNDRPDCTDQRPCSACLAMSNIFRMKVDQTDFVRELGLALTAPPAQAETAGEERVHGRTAMQVCDLVEERIAEGVPPGANFPAEWLPLLVRALRAAQRHGTQAGAGERVRHVKRGTEYEVVGEAEAQVSDGTYAIWPKGTDPMSDAAAVSARHLHDGLRLTVYRDLKTGKLWCRFTDEFRDGRFVTLAPAQAGAGDGWQPIETAPNHRPECDRSIKQPRFIGTDGDRVGEARSFNGGFYWEDGEKAKLVRWQPLPAAPIGTGNGEASA